MFGLPLPSICAAGLILLGSGCVPGPTSVDDLDTVVTAPAEGTDFSALRSYRMADHVLDVTAGFSGTGGGAPLADAALGAFLLGEVRRNVEQDGFVEAPAPDVTPPDVLLLISVQREDWVESWNDWGWYPGWSWYSGGYGSGWSLGYPSVVSTLSFSTGTLHIDMVRPDPASMDLSIPVVWSASINGLLSEEGISEERLSMLIDQAFAQSSYLEADR